MRCPGFHQPQTVLLVVRQNLTFYVSFRQKKMEVASFAVSHRAAAISETMLYGILPGFSRYADSVFRLIPSLLERDVIVNPRSAIFPRTFGISMFTVAMMSQPFVLRKFMIANFCLLVNTPSNHFFAKRKILIAIFPLSWYSDFHRGGGYYLWKIFRRYLNSVGKILA